MMSYMPKEQLRPTLTYIVEENGMERREIGIHLNPKSLKATTIIDGKQKRKKARLFVEPCLLIRKNTPVEGMQVTVKVDKTLAIPLFLFANYTFMALQIPDTKPDLHDKHIRPDRTITRVKSGTIFDRAIHAAQILATSIHLQQKTRNRITRRAAVRLA
jgi:hypothetical protein